MKSSTFCLIGALVLFQAPTVRLGPSYVRILSQKG